MRDYAIVSPQFWTGTTGRQIRNMGSDAQVIALYLMTAPGSNMIGLYYLPLPTLCHEVGCSQERAVAALRCLRACGFAAYDPESEFVFLPEMARFQVGDGLKTQDNRRISVLKELKASGGRCPEFGALFWDRYCGPYNLGDPIYPMGPSHERIPAQLRCAVLARDQSCRGCGGVEDLTFDHVLARINGGLTVLDNLQLLCRPCNTKKSAEDRKLFWSNTLETTAPVVLNPFSTPRRRVSDKSGSQDQEQEQDQDHAQEEEKPAAGGRSFAKRVFLPQPLSGRLDTPELQSAWSAYAKHRREIKKPLTPTAAEHAASWLAEIGPERALVALRHTIAKGWQGLREPDPPLFARSSSGDVRRTAGAPGTNYGPGAFDPDRGIVS